MENLWEKVKAHPWLAVGIVLVVFILVYLLVGGSSSPQSSGTPQDNYAAEVAAATQLQNAQLQAQTAAKNIDAQLSAQQGQYQAATTIAQLEAQAQTQTASTNAGVATAYINAQAQTQQQQIAATEATTQQYNTIYGQIQSNAIAAQQAVALAGFNAQEQMNGSNNAVQENIYSNYFNTIKAINDSNNQLATYGITSNEYVDLAQLEAAYPGTGWGLYTPTGFQGTPNANSVILNAAASASYPQSLQILQAGGLIPTTQPAAPTPIHMYDPGPLSKFG